MHFRPRSSARHRKMGCGDSDAQGRDVESRRISLVRSRASLLLLCLIQDSEDYVEAPSSSTMHGEVENFFVQCTILSLQHNYHGLGFQIGSYVLQCRGRGCFSIHIVCPAGNMRKIASRLPAETAFGHASQSLGEFWRAPPRRIEFLRSSSTGFLLRLDLGKVARQFH